MTTDEVRDVVKYLLAGYPAQRSKMKPDDAVRMYAFYCTGLADLDDPKVVLAAIDRLAKTARFIPTVAEIREAVGVVHHGEQSPASKAWGAVARAMHDQGAYRTPGVDFLIADPIAADVVRDIGWESMCTGLPDHIRSRFMDGYAERQKLERKVAQVSPGGVNRALGSRATPDRIGGATIAQLVAHVKPDGVE